MTALYAAYLGRSPDSGGYDAWVAALATSTRDEVRHGFAYSSEFQNDVGQLCVTTSSTSASLKYVLSDVQGTTRALMNNNGSGSSTIVARHDYLPFGEEIWAGSYRSSSQAYGKTDAIRQKYGLTERDDATGLDHTWWRKLESFSGRWTSPDPYNGSMTTADPQSFNRFNYVQNDPINFVDPSGLDGKPGDLCPGGVIGNDGKCHAGPSAVVTVGMPPSLFGDFLPNWTSGQVLITIGLLGGGFGGNPLIPGRGPAPVTPQKPTPPPTKPGQRTDAQKRKEYEDCVKRAVDGYHQRADAEERANAVFVLGYDPDTGDFKGAAATVGVGLVNKLRGGAFGVGLGITIVGRFAVAQAHGLGYEMGNWERFKKEAHDCVTQARMP